MPPSPACLLLISCSLPGLPPPALWSEIEEEVCTATYDRVGGVGVRAGGRCCVHGEGAFLDIIRYCKPMRVLRRF